MVRKLSFIFVALLWASAALGQANTGYPPGAVPRAAVATGTTGSVAASLPGIAGLTTYICGFQVSSTGGTATSGPLTVATLAGGVTLTYQLAVNATGVPVNFDQTFSPCLPASTPGQAITVTTTANGTATAVDVQAWGYRQ